MSTNISKLLRVLSSQKKLSHKLYETLMNDTSVSAEVKKKVALYYKGDKRLSVVKFQDLLKKRIKGQKGGGWKIGAVAGENQYVVQAQGRRIEDIQPLIMYPTTPGTPSPTVSPLALNEEFIYNALNYITTDKLGEGAFAKVYKFTPNPVTFRSQTPSPPSLELDHVVKIFKHLSSSVLVNTEYCINEFILNFRDKIIYTSLPLHPQLTVSIFTTALDGKSNGYVMRELKSIDTNNIKYLLAILVSNIQRRF